VQVPARSTLGHTALLKALNNIPQASDNDVYISIGFINQHPQSFILSHQHQPTGKFQLGSDPHLHGQHANTGEYNFL
jgi:hypothetical protein